MGSMFEAYEVTFEVYAEDKLINRQIMEAPKEMLIANFLKTVNQISRDKRALKVRMIRPEKILDKFENREKIINNEVAFSNNAMVAWEDVNKR